MQLIPIESVFFFQSKLNAIAIKFTGNGRSIDQVCEIDGPVSFG